MYSEIDKVFFFKEKIENNRYSITFLFTTNLRTIFKTMNVLYPPPQFPSIMISCTFLSI